ncbi:hypothetical protein ACSBR1_013105 [Camellia fascicularis]
MEGEASCSSISGARKLQNVVERDVILRNELVRGFDVVNSSVHVKKGGFDLKGNNEIECSSLPVGSGADANHFNYDKDAPVVKNLGDRASHGFQLDETLHEKKLAEKNESSYEEIKSNVQKELGYEGNEKNAIRILEQALEEEHAACAALYLELEKERSAAATAADEAMAIILRLQDEKASIEMEAWQYQRIIEEKSAYDAEEMNILKEILVRRQKDKHFLEREVEAYRRMIHIGN